MSNVQLYKSRVFVLAWHLIAFVQFVYAIYFDWNFVKIPENVTLKMVQPGIGGRTRFLTYWCLVSRVSIVGSVECLDDSWSIMGEIPVHLSILR